MKKHLYPKSVKVRKRRYKVKMVSGLKADNTALRGYCDPNKPHTIYLDKNLKSALLFSTFMHEVLHAIEVEYKLKVPHKLVYALEGPLAKLLKDNFHLFFKR